MDTPIVFLDVDGVLNDLEILRNFSAEAAMLPESLSENERFEKIHILMLNPVLVARMRDTVREVGAEVVLSSTWRRHFSPEQMKSMLAERGWEGAPIIGVTSTVSDRDLRGEEIQDWMGQFGGGRPFVIIDDDDDMLPGQPFVQTDSAIGFAPEDQVKVLDILKP